MKALNLATLALAALAAATGLESSYRDGWLGEIASGAPKPVMPALIAFGCEGSGGALWANEESDFPTQCKDIRSTSYAY